ncbi:MAG TPA: enoyl-CoA hydratase [Hyphomonadaceae bacterium]|nr:enoyl-CoA hydratase [Hyphomonadaceae bacterium]
MSYETIQLAVADGVATLTLNRPERLNAFNGAMIQDLLTAFDETDRNDDVRALVVTGAGRAFCAGADLGSGAETFNYDKRRDRGESADAVGDHRDGGGVVALRIYESLKPVIAAVNGAAIGVGATMLCAMDVRLASPAARFGFVFARRGIVPETLSSYFLPRLVGVSTALEWFMTGRIFDANEALARGLVRSLHEPDQILPAAYALAREIADNTSPVSVALARRMVLEMLAAEHPMEAHRLESQLMVERGASADAAEGVTSFLEKRPARFPMKVSTDMPDWFPPKPPPFEG